MVDNNSRLKNDPIASIRNKNTTTTTTTTTNIFGTPLHSFSCYEHFHSIISSFYFYRNKFNFFILNQPKFFFESRYFSCQMFLSVLSIYFHRKSVKWPNREKKERGVINSLSSLSPEIVDSWLVMALSSCWKAGAKR